jgi:hypothetical protein
VRDDHSRGPRAVPGDSSKVSKVSPICSCLVACSTLELHVVHPNA